MEGCEVYNILLLLIKCTETTVHCLGCLLKVKRNNWKCPFSFFLTRMISKHNYLNKQQNRMELKSTKSGQQYWQLKCIYSFQSYRLFHGLTFYRRYASFFLLNQIFQSSSSIITTSLDKQAGVHSLIHPLAYTCVMPDSRKGTVFKSAAMCLHSAELVICNQPLNTRYSNNYSVLEQLATFCNTTL